MKIFVTAHLPDALEKAWLQHIRDFDVSHPGCHFEIAADTPHLSLAEMVELVRVDPALTFTEIIKRRRVGGNE